MCRVLAKKSEELFERAKAEPPTKPELRDIDLD